MDLSFLSDNACLRTEIQDIKNNILIILDEVHHNRYYINKHFQNCMINYFLRNLNFPFLSQVEPRYACSKTMNTAIQQKYVNAEGAIYLRLMKGYLQEIQAIGKLEEYRSTLVMMIMQDIPNTKYLKKDQKQITVDDLKSNKEYQSEIWKKAFSLFVLFHSYNQNIKGIFEIWNSLFPQDQIKRKRKQNINHIIVIPSRNDQNSIQTKSEVEQEQEVEEQEIKQNIQFSSQQATSGFQFFGHNDHHLHNPVVKQDYSYSNQYEHHAQEDYPNYSYCYYSSSSSVENNQYFTYPTSTTSTTTMCSSNNFFTSLSGDSPFSSSSDSQDIKVMYDEQLNTSPQNDQNQSSGEYDELQSGLQYDTKHADEVCEPQYMNIQVSKKTSPSSKGRKRRCNTKEISQEESYLQGRKALKVQEYIIQEKIILPSYLTQQTFPFLNQASLSSLTFNPSSTDLNNQGSKKDFSTC